MNNRLVGKGTRAGVRVIDVLVSSIAIIILLSVIIPFILFLRTKVSRRSACEERLVNIGKAVLKYEIDQNRYPAGTLGFSNAIEVDQWNKPNGEQQWRRAQQSSFLMQIVPYTEFIQPTEPVNSLLLNPGQFVNIPNADNQYDWFGEIPGANGFAKTHVPHFLCPEDDLMDAIVELTGASQPVISGSPTTDYFSTLVWSVDQAEKIGRTNYLACAGAFSGGIHPDPERRKYVGMMSSRQRVTRNDVATADGLSHSVMAGETIGSFYEGQRTRASSWAFGGLARGRGAFDWMSDPATAQRPSQYILGNIQYASNTGFGSKHPGGVFFLYAGGNTEFISHAVDWRAFYSMCGYRDGTLSENQKLQNRKK